MNPTTTLHDSLSAAATNYDNKDSGDSDNDDNSGEENHFEVGELYKETLIPC